MPLANGSRFGPYQITSQLGEGGMGEVYRAHDSRLGRDVALKVLHTDFAQNPNLRSRFEREARAVAALNHPNIVALFDVGEENGVAYFVSELVEGDSLRSRLEHGPLPLRELLDIAVQIADGVSAAHAAGITHRDLKPENIMITRDGRIKILDFGLARTAATAATVQDRTVTINETQPGAVLGTPNYMSPEQVRGLPVDYRSDQFSFGVMLFEMASGKQAFLRESSILTMSAVVTDEPPLADPALQSRIPPPLRWTIERCLAKEPSRRYESTRDLYADLRAQRDHLSDTYSTAVHAALPQAKAPAAQGYHWKAAAAVLALITAVVGWLLFDARNANDTANYRFTPFAVSSEGQGNAAWSWDGKAAAYLGEVDGAYQIFVRYLNSQVPVQLTTTGVRGLYGWSPDNKRIFFRAKNPNTGGPPSAVFSIAAVGGEPEELMPLDAITSDISPDGKTLAAFKVDKDGYRRIYISSPIGSTLQPYPSSKFATRLQLNTPRLRFSPDGRKILLLINDGREKRWLMDYPASKDNAREVMSALPRFGTTPGASWFPDSRHVVVSVPQYLGGPPNLWIADTRGSSLRRLTSTPTAQYLPAVSPDGQKILYQEVGTDYDIAKVTLTDGKLIRLIATEREESMPSWAYHTGKFAYVTNRSGPYEIWMRSEDGADKPLVTAAAFAPAEVNDFMDPTLSPDGDRVFYTMIEVNGKVVMYVSSTAGGSPARVTNADISAEFPGSVSPDGRQLAYLGLEGNRADLMVVKTSVQAKPVRLRENVNGALPQWSPTGEWITFQDDAGWHLISPDGKNIRDLGKIDTTHLTFSLDGKKLYGIRQEKEHQYLFWLDAGSTGGKSELKTVAEIGKDYAPTSNFSPGYRLSVAPDGTCAIYTVATYKSSIWLFEGFKK